MLLHYWHGTAGHSYLELEPGTYHVDGACECARLRQTSPVEITVDRVERTPASGNEYYHDGRNYLPHPTTPPGEVLTPHPVNGNSFTITEAGEYRIGRGAGHTNLYRG